MTNANNSELVIIQDVDYSDFQKIESVDVLAPGHYWRVKVETSVVDTQRKYRSGAFDYVYQVGDVHLLLDIFEFESTPHSAIVLSHPRDGAQASYRILIAEFLANFEPAMDAESVRSKEQADIMSSVASVQEEMAQAQVNPLALPGIQTAAEEAIDRFSREMEAEIAATQTNQEQKEIDLRKLHRRAARRSTAAGNPLTVKSVTISDQVGLMISGGVDSEGLRDLTFEAKKRIAIAETTSKWLVRRAEDMGSMLKSLTPYYSEKAQVALALSSKTIKYVKDITQGLTSLKLYTGDGIDVIPVVEGKSASTHHPLMLVQGKRFMDEELAVWADVGDEFDWRDQARFFASLKSTPSLVNQVFPSERCVVSMAVTARSIEYSKDVSAYEKVVNELRNRSVFLLVRDGENIHVVYSSEPSHEAASRLFPTQSEIEGPFKGVDGTKIGLQDVAFGKASEKFNDVSLHYKRFLILLCGLDHRMKLFGEFYPAEEGLQFMSMEFQAKYFHFFEDDNAAGLIGDSLESVDSWMDRCNKAIRSGSRIIVCENHHMTASSPQLKRVRTVDINFSGIPDQMIVSREKGNHNVTVPTVHHFDRTRGQALVWLDGPDSVSNKDWFLCVDLVRISTLQRYIYSRVNRSGNISWLRAFKKAEIILKAERESQLELRKELSIAAVENGILRDDEVDEAIEVAISTWRAANRGADAPEFHDKKAFNELLTLMFPFDRIAVSTEKWMSDLIAKEDLKPLKLCRTGRNKLVLYVEATEKEQAEFGIYFGWVKRLVVDVLKTKISVSSSSFVWLNRDQPNAEEVIVREWLGLNSWLQNGTEPCTVKALIEMKAEIDASSLAYGDLLSQSRDKPLNLGIDPARFKSIRIAANSCFMKMTIVYPIYVAVPVGITQKSKGSPVLFIYSYARAFEFVGRYGSLEQIAEYKKYVFNDSARNIKLSTGKNGLNWRFIQTTEPIKKSAFVLESIERCEPNWMTVEGHESGGYTKKQFKDSFSWKNKSTRAGRRAKGGDPSHISKTLPLSFNRSIDTLMGQSPRTKKEFYSNRCNGFYGRKSEEKYEKKIPLAYLSPLIWNADLGRSMANKYFWIKPT